MNFLKHNQPIRVKTVHKGCLTIILDTITLLYVRFAVVAPQVPNSCGAIGAQHFSWGAKI